MNQLAGIILAAGTSSRFGADNKLLFPYGGQAMVRWVAEAAIAAQLNPVIVVTGHDAAGVQAALKGLNLVFAYNVEFASGQASSLKTGIAAVPERCTGAIILLGDMPDVDADIVNQLSAEFVDNTSIVVPRYDGVRGNPVVLGSAYFAGLARLSGDKGARELLAGDHVRFVDVASQAVLRDFDTLEKFRDQS